MDGLDPALVLDAFRGFFDAYPKALALCPVTAFSLLLLVKFRYVVADWREARRWKRYTDALDRKGLDHL